MWDGMYHHMANKWRKEDVINEDEDVKDEEKLQKREEVGVSSNVLCSSNYSALRFHKFHPGFDIQERESGANQRQRVKRQSNYITCMYHCSIFSNVDGLETNDFCLSHLKPLRSIKK
ncbi:hypothetical protein K7X08_024262 [Anisodus acutangulus]|uniref:Uncharacterized protein n=1 Tax=Anisodus acutangulus TaxID=402998 RepID=A0A9Q1RFI2_9SOLA|nr:hypothetical protein K7X08_024262 [Anisodus acutangulus]